MYHATTNDIDVEVEPFYIDEQSDPDEDRYVWGYHITITNRSPSRIQLISRYWHITDENGHVDEVAGKGVVGDEPFLEPGGSFEYSSGCPLDTPSGIMVGRYQFKTDAGLVFDAEIPAFSLDRPDVQRVLN